MLLVGSFALSAPASRLLTATMGDLEITNTPSSKAASDQRSPSNLGDVGSINEKIASAPGSPNLTHRDDEEEERDIDALIDELESHDGHEDAEEIDGHDEATDVVRAVPEAFLNTDTRRGLTETEVVARRKKFGLNQMKEEKENLILKFLGYFVGPIQFVMEVRVLLCISPTD